MRKLGYVAGGVLFISALWVWYEFRKPIDLNFDEDDWYV